MLAKTIEEVKPMNITTCSDEEFAQYKKYWAERVTAIRLPADINSQIGQQILSSLDEAYAYLRIDLGEIEGVKEKAESIIRQFERSKAEGTNEDNRKKNATEYLENYPIGDGETINMYDWYRLIDTRYKTINSFVTIINNKQQRLITMTGLMKIDKDLGSGMHGS